MEFTAYTPAALVLGFAFYYPLFMSYLWMVGGLYYFLHWESRPRRGRQSLPTLSHYPFVSILIPCYNEGENIRDTIAVAAAQDYPNFEIIAINDGSVDETGALLEALVSEYPMLRVIHHAGNHGKALALRTGALAARGEYLVCVDGDALLDYEASYRLVRHFLTGPRVGAVTGNPRIRNRSTLLGKLQVGEFSSTVGLIKRAQRIYGRIFTVSGVIVAFRKAALQRVGYWSTDMVTEDIDISWKLQLDHWDVRYEPKALCWILMPETLKGLWRQRLRWAQGGAECLLRYSRAIPPWRKRRFWGVYLEFVVSVAWAYSMALVLLLWLIGLAVELPAPLRVDTLLPQWHGLVLAFTCTVQFGISMLIDRRYDHGLGRNYYWMIWYPLGYWALNMLTTVIALPRALFMKRGSTATWISPDRGVQQERA
jgi:biofilm PGA synthesis N-glycosyltransferase PgaC